MTEARDVLMELWGLEQDHPKPCTCCEALADDLIANLEKNGFVIVAKSELAAARGKALEWQPIETAPKREVILGGKLGYISQTFVWDREFGGGWISGTALQYQPTHWMPLPAFLSPISQATEET